MTSGVQRVHDIMVCRFPLEPQFNGLKLKFWIQCAPSVFFGSKHSIDGYVKALQDSCFHVLVASRGGTLR